MTQYIDAIAHSLEIWDGGKLSSRNRDHYKHLSWSGEMINSKPFNNLNNQIKKNILAANKAEGDANNRATSSAKGNRCN